VSGDALRPVRGEGEAQRHEAVADGSQQTGTEVVTLWFLAVLGVGVAGAGVATVISQGVSVVRLHPVRLPSRARRCSLPDEKRHFHVGSRLYWELFSQSISMGLMSSIVSAGSVVLHTHQRAGHAGHRGPHRRPEALFLHGYASDGDGLRLLDIRIPELRREPPRPRPARDARRHPLQHRGGRRHHGADERGGRMDGPAGVRFL